MTSIQRTRSPPPGAIHLDEPDLATDAEPQGDDCPRDVNELATAANAATPRGLGKSPGTQIVHRDRDRLIHFAVQSVIAQTGLGVGRGQSGPADLDACIVATWILSGGRSCADYVRGLEHWKNLGDFALQLTQTLKSHIERAADSQLLMCQLQGADHLTVRLAYQRVRAAHPWRVRA